MPEIKNHPNEQTLTGTKKETESISTETKKEQKPKVVGAAAAVSPVPDEFTKIVKLYPSGKKRSAAIEFEVFRKHKDWKEVLPGLYGMVDKYLKTVEDMKFCKHLQGFLSGRMWEKYSAEGEIQQVDEDKPFELIFPEYLDFSFNPYQCTNTEKDGKTNWWADFFRYYFSGKDPVLVAELKKYVLQNNWYLAVTNGCLQSGLRYRIEEIFGFTPKFEKNILYLPE